MMWRFKSMMRGAAAAAMLAFAAPAQAGGVPVFDATSLAQMVLEYQQALQQFAESQAQTTELIAQTREAYAQTQHLIRNGQTLVRQVEAMTGARDVSGLLNAAEDAARRRRLPTMLGGLDALGLDVDTDFAAAVEDIHAQFPLLRAEGLDPYAEAGADASGPVRSHIEAANTIVAGIAAARTAMQDAPADVAALEALIARIDETADMKASSDLGARMAAQTGLAVTKLTQLLAIQMEMQGAQALRDVVWTEAGRVGGYNPHYGEDFHSGEGRR